MFAQAPKLITLESIRELIDVPAASIQEPPPKPKLAIVDEDISTSIQELDNADIEPRNEYPILEDRFRGKHITWLSREVL